MAGAFSAVLCVAAATSGGNAAAALGTHFEGGRKPVAETAFAGALAARFATVWDAGFAGVLPAAFAGVLPASLGAGLAAVFDADFAAGFPAVLGAGFAAAFGADFAAGFLVFSEDALSALHAQVVHASASTQSAHRFIIGSVFIQTYGRAMIRRGAAKVQSRGACPDRLRERTLGAAWVDDIPERQISFWKNDEHMAEGNPVLMLERGEALSTPPALWLQGRPDPIHDYRDPEAPVELNEPERFAASYRKTGGTIEMLYIEQAGRTTAAAHDPIAAFFLREMPVARKVEACA